MLDNLFGPMEKTMRRISGCVDIQFCDVHNPSCIRNIECQEK